jgi:hypothetical protein
MPMACYAIVHTRRRHDAVAGSSTRDGLPAAPDASTFSVANPLPQANQPLTTRTAGRSGKGSASKRSAPQ